MAPCGESNRRSSEAARLRYAKFDATVELLPSSQAVVSGAWADKSAAAQQPRGKTHCRWNLTTSRSAPEGLAGMAQKYQKSESHKWQTCAAWDGYSGTAFQSGRHAQPTRVAQEGLCETASSAPTG